MICEILNSDTFPMVRCSLEDGEIMRARIGATVSMSEAIEVDDSTGETRFESYKHLVAGDVFPYQRIVARNGAGTVFVSHDTPGSVRLLDLKIGEVWRVSTECFLFASETVEMSLVPDQIIPENEEEAALHMLEVKGPGTAAIGCYGSVFALAPEPDEVVRVDTAHIIGWRGQKWPEIVRTSRSSNWKETGEDYSAQFTGPASVLIQSGNLRAVRRALLDDGAKSDCSGGFCLSGETRQTE